MKYLRPALILALVCFVSVGSAFATRVVFDPTQTGITLNGDVNDIFTLSPPAPFTWSSCTGNPDVGVLAPGLLTANNGSAEDACAEFANFTGAAITSITFAYTPSPTIPGAGAPGSPNAGVPQGCETLTGDPHLTTANCTFTSDTFTYTFSGGASIPPSGNGLISVFFIGEDGISFTDISNVSWTASVPEPSSLTLLAAGMGLLGLCFAFVKR